MNIDFASVLAALAALTGIVWLIDILWLKPKRKARGDAGEPWPVEYARSFFPVIFAVLLLRSFLVEPFRIPSNSMMPTLLTGDFILVNKFTYGIRLPVINVKIFEIGAPKRGDVFVFRFPKEPSIDYIKRVIGIPGDHIVYKNKVLYINETRVDQTALGLYTGVGSGIVMSGAAQLVEKLDDVKHDILVDPRKNYGDFDVRVPPGSYFAMGDNRDNSNDSRFWGMVPEANLVGKAFMIWMNFDSADSRVDWSRIGSRIN